MRFIVASGSLVMGCCGSSEAEVEAAEVEIEVAEVHKRALIAAAHR